MAELLIGCGSSREKKLHTPGRAEWAELRTLDFSPACAPDVVHDLNVLPYPFVDDEFDEVHAYCVLEHCGRQGDWKFFLDQFAELWRITKPNGYLHVICPHYTSPWAWGDISHTRIIGLEQVSFLSQKWLREQNTRTPVSHYLEYYRADWELAWSQQTPDLQQAMIMRALK